MNPHDFAVETVQEAGELLLEKRDQGFKISTKNSDPGDIVTSVDTAVNAFIVEKIRAAFPADGIYSEEGGGNVSVGERQWTIDPIDGSSNFSHNIPHYAVCLGLLESGVVVAGAIYNPVTRELFSFEKGKGAFLDGNPIHVSEKIELKDSMVFLRAGRTATLSAWGGASYQRLLENVSKTGNFGSSALDICFLAAGRIDAVVYGTLTALDIAPALALLKEAGGVISTATGEEPELTPERQRIYMANNKTILDAIRALLEA